LHYFAQEHQKKFRAEQQILLFLIHCPEKVPEISQMLSPNCFYTNMHRNIYFSICKEQFPCFSETEQSCITDIEEEYQGITPSWETITDCISILQNQNHNLIS
ncbi:MAG: hypothetical protein K2J71_05205, partial [Oscillospiraceae bacterium]|nr:hypothetical protein [Oscillospiraceae bacterium]